MIDQIVRAIRGVIPDETWDFIFEQFTPSNARFSQPSYLAVRVSKDYMLVRVPKKETNEKSNP